MAVSKALRFQVLRRDNHACRYCGGSAPEVKLTVDHVVATALGGSDKPDNLVTACSDCNGGKSATPPDAAVVEDVAEDALRWARARDVAARRLLADLEDREAARDAFYEHWSTWSYGPEKARKPIPLPVEWRHSVDNFTAAGLPFQVLIDCMERAMTAQKVTPENTFRYMCGIAWNRVTEMNEMAKRHLERGEGDAGDEWSRIPREELEEHVWWFSGAVENFLKGLPVWVHEKAERRTDHDLACAGDSDASYLHRLPHVLRHAGNVLAECQIDPTPVEAD